MYSSQQDCESLGAYVRNPTERMKKPALRVRGRPVSFFPPGGAGGGGPWRPPTVRRSRTAAESVWRGEDPSDLGADQEKGRAGRGGREPKKGGSRWEEWNKGMCRFIKSLYDMMHLGNPDVFKNDLVWSEFV